MRKYVIVGYFMVLLLLNAVTFIVVYLNAGNTVQLMEADILRIQGDVKMYHTLLRCTGDM